MNYKDKKRDEDKIEACLAILEQFKQKQKEDHDLLKDNNNKISITIQKEYFKNIVDYIKIDTSQTKQILKNQWNREIC